MVFSISSCIETIKLIDCKCNISFCNIPLLYAKLFKNYLNCYFIAARRIILQAQKWVHDKSDIIKFFFSRVIISFEEVEHTGVEPLNIANFY
ncbi:hypothetical protein HMPREF9304_06790 [Hoylesella timonensis S9-PR14]|uniref:Uncharacterized protein n=1 Tax=Hoylesella timonensis S9-PR14 TaxID=1401062 RepID=A0A098YS01_9BACT|nr:hypothetical protein HMPREF9304_06790 [Hoylesella timonensis S9-PR14]